MIRFWSRITHNFKHENKEFSSSLFDEYSTLPVFFRGTRSAYTVNTERLQRASRRSMDLFIQAWYSEMEKVYLQSQKAIVALELQLQALSQGLCMISSPVKNPDKDQLARVHQFIAACLKEWDSHFTCSVNIITQTNDVHHLQFSKVSIQHKINLKERNKTLYSCQQSHQYRIKQATRIGYLKLDACMHQFFCLEQDLLLYHHYVSSQFSLLWDLGGYMNSAMASKWNHMQSLSLMNYQRLQHQLKTTLETNAPVAHDYTCAVCLDLFQEPTVLSPCRHTFCRSCIQRYFCASCHQHMQRKRTRLADKLGMRVRPAIYCACYGVDDATRPFCRRGTCPLCRQLFTAGQCSLDIKLERFMELYFPEREEREHEIQDNRERVYDKIQRWSCRLAQAHETCTEDVLQNGMLLLARRSWIF